MYDPQKKSQQFSIIKPEKGSYTWKETEIVFTKEKIEKILLVWHGPIIVTIKQKLSLKFTCKTCLFLFSVTRES